MFKINPKLYYKWIVYSKFFHEEEHYDRITEGVYFQTQEEQKIIKLEPYV